ncbi:uncharacterized protein LOC128212271 isoform X2 [Mya arenaria]|uniref:uncharacterized protein LOC128212271 isoform X2 n=1 Tax=Mya arenaria TaxID=6604 RepID=UPI0022E58D68|nr:uncharacterized protein LOC128212271 isoform X2 [Mya arenaria]
MSGENASSVPQVPPRNGRNMAAALMAEGTGTHFEEVTISAHHWHVDKALGIQQFIHDTIGAKFVIDEIQNLAVFKCQSDVKPNLDSAIDQFKKSIRWKTVKFTEHTSVLLWFGSEPNAKLKHYFNFIKRFKGPFYADICLQESKPTCVVYSRDGNILSKAVDAISSSLVYSRCSEAIIHPRRTIVVEAQQEGLLQLLNTEKNFVSFVCTNDVLNSIQNNLCTEKIEIPSTVANYFNCYAEECIHGLARKTNVEIEFPILQKTLKIRGVLNEINQFKSQLDTLFVEKHTTVQLTKEEKVLIAEYLRQVAGEHRCIADLSNCDIQEDESTCCYLVSWSHVRNTGRLSVVEGNVQNMDVDFVIIPADRNKQPLSQTAAKVLPALSKVSLINVQSSSRGFPLSTKLRSVAMPFVGRKIAVFVPDNDLDKRFFLAELVTMFQTLPATQIYIVTPALEEIIQIIDDNFRSVKSTLTENSGFFREKHVENILTKTGLHEVDIQVTKRSLLESEADALVITVGSDLDLARGNLCTQILNAAGQIIQEDLRTKQKERHSNVYVTHAGELGFRSPGHKVKCIIHCLLQQFNKDDFMSVLISFVETCLLEADMKMCTSVAFPALGTGNLGYPVRDVAVAMFEAVRTYRKKVINPSVKKVIFCVGKPENEVFRASRRR